MTNRIAISEYQLRLAQPLRQHEAPKLREVFGRRFEDKVLLHSQQPDGTPIYQYPRVQFKVFHSTAVLLGIKEGSLLLQQLWLDINQEKLGDQQIEVLASRIETREERIDVTAEPIAYRFITPWLALNQKNFHEYVRSRNQRFRKDELSRILVGNCLGLAKSLGIGLTNYVTADCRGLTSMKTVVKDNGTVGFVGKFQLNLRLPDLIGLGKAVHRGFGAVAPLA